MSALRGLTATSRWQRRWLWPTATVLVTWRPPPSGHENRATSHLAVVQIVECRMEVSQRIRARVQGDLTTGGQDHQLGQIVVRADQVSDEVDLRRDDVDGRNAYRPAVADDVVIAVAA